MESTKVSLLFSGRPGWEINSINYYRLVKCCGRCGCLLKGQRSELRLEDFRGGPVGTEQDCGKVGPMIKKQTTKLRGSRLTAWQSRGLGLANWNARRPGLLRVFVLCAGPQYSRVSPGPAPRSGPVFSRHSL